jgi:hypothetical protein
MSAGTRPSMSRRVGAKGVQGADDLVRKIIAGSDSI